MIKEEHGEGTWAYLLDLHRLLYTSHLIAQRLYSTYYPSAASHADHDLVLQPSPKEHKVCKLVAKEFTRQKRVETERRKDALVTLRIPMNQK